MAAHGRDACRRSAPAVRRRPHADAARLRGGRCFCSTAPTANGPTAAHRIPFAASCTRKPASRPSKVFARYGTVASSRHRHAAREHALPRTSLSDADAWRSRSLPTMRFRLSSCPTAKSAKGRSTDRQNWHVEDEPLHASGIALVLTGGAGPSYRLSPQSDGAWSGERLRAPRSPIVAVGREAPVAPNAKPGERPGLVDTLLQAVSPRALGGGGRCALPCAHSAGADRARCRSAAARACGRQAAGLCRSRAPACPCRCGRRSGVAAAPLLAAARAPLRAELRLRSERPFGWQA